MRHIGSSFSTVDIDGNSANDYLPLDYDRTTTYYESPGDQPAEWQPWTDDVNVIFSATGRRPRPILGDIDFTGNGSMVLSFIDRTSMQMGSNNYQPNPAITTLYSYISGGDLRQLCNIGSLANPVYAPEGTSGCTQNYLPPAYMDADPANLVIPRFYNTVSPFRLVPSGAGPEAGHAENPFGGLATHKQTSSLVYTAMNPTNGVSSGGLRWLGTSSGDIISNYLLYVSGSPVGNFSKAAGLGDIELLCSLPPIEIGNRVWLDIDADGIQDAGEPGISGVTVQLYDATGATLLGTAMTDGSGAYYFNSTNVTGGILPATDYIVRVPNVTGGSKQAALGTNALTLPNAGTDDEIDSDGTSVGVNGDFAITTGADGSVTHRIDFGFFACPTITTPSAAQNICEGATGAEITVQTDQNAANSIRFLRFTTDQSATNGSETPAELAAIYSGGTVLATVTPTGGSAPYTATLTAAAAGWDAAMPGVYYVYAILNPDLGAACRPVQEVVVTVVEEPFLDANDLTICETAVGAGASVTLEDLVQNPDGAALTFTEGGNPVAQPLAVGTHTIQVEAASSPAGCLVTTTFTITVLDYPTAQPICPGETYTLSAPATATNVIWYRDGAVVGAGTNYTVTTIGTYTYTADGPNGCATGNCCPAVFVQADCMSVGSTVFHDENNNGIFDNTEMGIPNVALQLFNGDGTPFDVDAATAGLQPYIVMTNGNGDYLFSELPPGDYLISIATPPASTPLSSSPWVTDTNPDNQEDNDDNGIQSSAGGITVSAVFSLVANSESTSETGTGGAQDDGSEDDNGDMTIDFGFFAPVSLGDYVWIDDNADGLQDIGESPLEGVVVTLYGANGALVTTDAVGDPLPGAIPGQMVTDALGGYSFTNLAPGDYYVVFDISGVDGAGFYTFTVQGAGSNASDSDANPTNGQSTPTGFLPSGTSYPFLDAGVRCDVAVEAGTGITVCATATVDLTTLGASITPAVPGFGGTWSSSGTGTFNDGNTGRFGVATAYMPSAADVQAGQVVLTLTSDNPATPPFNAQACDAAQDEVMIIILKVNCGTFPWDGN